MVYINMISKYERPNEFKSWLYNLLLISVKYFICWALLIEEEFKPTRE